MHDKVVITPAAGRPVVVSRTWQVMGCLWAMEGVSGAESCAFRASSLALGTGDAGLRGIR